MAINERNYDPKGESRREVLFQWADDVIKRWLKEMETQGITDAKKLSNHFERYVFNASGGNHTKIEFMYLDYLRYLDVGVGRGEKYKRVKHDPVFYSGVKYPRTEGFKYQVKPWFLPILRQRTYSLQKILERKFFEYAETIILKGVTNI